jgi:hypothetical protein
VNRLDIATISTNPHKQLFLAPGCSVPFMAIIGGQLQVQLAPLILVALFLLV